MQQLPTAPPASFADTNAPELYQGENVDVGPQRILRVIPRWKYFDVQLDSQLFYTDNANFAQPADKIASAVFVNSIQAVFAPKPSPLGPGQSAPAIGFAAQWYNYENQQMSPFDFNAQTLFFGEKYSFGKWQIGAGANYTRLLNQSDYRESYTEFMPTLGVQRIFPIGERVLFSLGDQIDYHWTSVPANTANRTDINNRFDEVVSVMLSCQIARRLVFQPYYRFQYSHYQNDTMLTSDRNDYLSMFGISLFYSFNKNVNARAFFNYSCKQSDDSFTASYHEVDGGLGATLDFKF